MASAIGVSIPVLRFLLCFVGTIPVSFLHRFVPCVSGRHFYAALSGAVLSYLSFGFSSNLHFLVPMLLGYASMVLCRHYCGIITFFLAFGYLIGCHVYYMSGDAWKKGGMDATDLETFRQRTAIAFWGSVKSFSSSSSLYGIVHVFGASFPNFHVLGPNVQRMGFLDAVGLPIYG